MLKNDLQIYLDKPDGANPLSKRLVAIASYVEKGAVLADVGTDHGYIPIILAKAGILRKGYAMDINQGPLDKADGNIHAYHVSDQVTTVLSDGLNKLSDSAVNHIIIAGMGGMLISRILEVDKAKLKDVKRLILSPHHDIELVRRKVHELGFSIIHEEMIYDGQFYNIIVCEHGVEVYERDLEYRYGKILLEGKSEVFNTYIHKKLEQIDQILGQMGHNDSCKILERKTALEKEYDMLREVIGHD